MSLFPPKIALIATTVARHYTHGHYRGQMIENYTICNCGHPRLHPSSLPSLQTAPIIIIITITKNYSFCHKCRKKLLDLSLLSPKITSAAITITRDYTRCHYRHPRLHPPSLSPPEIARSVISHQILHPPSLPSPEIRTTFPSRQRCCQKLHTLSLPVTKNHMSLHLFCQFDSSS